MNLFEMEIEKSIDYWEKRDVLMGEKIREKVPFGRKISTGRSKFDFWLLMQGMFYGLECKMHRKTKSFSLSDINVTSERQITTLMNVDKYGGQGIFGLRTEVDKEVGPECFFVRILPILLYLRNKFTKTISVEILRKLSFVHQANIVDISDSKYIIWDIRKILGLSPFYRAEDFKMVEKGRLKERPYDIVKNEALIEQSFLELFGDIDIASLRIYPDKEKD